MIKKEIALDRRRFLVGGLSVALPLSAACGITGKGKKPSGLMEAPWRSVRERFPLDPKLTYMNNGGLGPSPYPVIETLTREMMELEAISESGHSRVAEVRRKACRFFGCGEDELAFTRSTTEGMNLIARGLPLKPGDEVLLSTHEHPGGAMPWLALARDSGIEVRLFEPGMGGSDTLERIRASIGPRTRVLSLSHVTCTTGMRVPAREIALLMREKGILSVFDGAQSAGMIPVDLHGMACDFYATSGHKWLLGPKGTGVLYIRKAMLDQWKPTFVGAYSDKGYDLDRLELELLSAARSSEYGIRNTPVLMALGAAFDFLEALGMERVAGHGAHLSSHLKKRLGEIDAMEVLTPMEESASGSMVTFRPRDGNKTPWEWVNTIKKEHKIRLRPVGEHGLNGIRVSTHVYNSLEEVDRLVGVLGKMVKG